MSDDFLKRTIAATDTAQQLRAIYGNKLMDFTKELYGKLQLLPKMDTRLASQDTRHSETPATHYFVDAWDGTKLFFVSVRKTRNYVNFKESGAWEEDESFPAILAICDDANIQKKLSRQMKRTLDDSWDDELVFATTTQKQLNEVTKPTEKIWLRVMLDNEMELESLKRLTADDE